MYQNGQRTSSLAPTSTFPTPYPFPHFLISVLAFVLLDRLLVRERWTRSWILPNASRYPLVESYNSFWYGDVDVKSVGIVRISLESLLHVPDIMVLMNIVSVNVPALLCLDILDAEGLYAVNFTNRLVHRKINSRSRELLVYADTSHVPIVRLDGHLYSRMSFPNTTFYNQQIQNLDRQFAHHSAKG